MPFVGCRGENRRLDHLRGSAPERRVSNDPAREFSEVPYTLKQSRESGNRKFTPVNAPTPLKGHLQRATLPPWSRSN